MSDLRGVRELFSATLKGQVDAFVSIDGTGHGITHVGVGSHRYRVTFRGPGGHSFGAFGLVNPIHALGRAVATHRRPAGAARAEGDVQRRPHRRRHVGELDRVGGVVRDGHAVVGRRRAASIDASFQKAVDEAVKDENARWNNGRVTGDKELVGDRPAGRTPRRRRPSCRPRSR